MSAAKKPAHTPGEWQKARTADRAMALAVLTNVSRSFPNLRLCQLIANATGEDDNFYMTDDRLADMLLAYEAKLFTAPKGAADGD